MVLSAFLVKAKINTYAAGGEGGERILNDGCKEFIFSEGDYRYRDRYYGSDPFIGEEVVWCNGRIVWAMNYYGRVLSEPVPAKKIYVFLKKAMRRVVPGRPFRGPDSFREGDLEYEDISKGDIDHFRGTETINYKGKKVYELYYHGGKFSKWDCRRMLLRVKFFGFCDKMCRKIFCLCLI